VFPADWSRAQSRVLLAGLFLAVLVIFVYTNSAGARIERAVDDVLARVAYHALGAAGVPVVMNQAQLISPRMRVEVENTLFPVLLALVAVLVWPLSTRERVLWVPGALLIAGFVGLIRVLSFFLTAVQNPFLALAVDRYLWPAVFAAVIVYGALRLAKALSKEEKPVSAQSPAS
jgi:hypothetical protein